SARNCPGSVDTSPFAVTRTSVRSEIVAARRSTSRSSMAARCSRSASSKDIVDCLRHRRPRSIPRCRWRDRCVMERGMPADVAAIAARLSAIPGVRAVVLGGSRARGTAMPESDVDLALYYEPDEPPAHAALDALACELDDRHPRGAVTSLG